MSKKVREKKQPTFFLAVLPILAMILLLGIGYAVLGLSAEVLMLVSAAVAAVAKVPLMARWFLSRLLQVSKMWLQAPYRLRAISTAMVMRAAQLPALCNHLRSVYEFRTFFTALY